jgi:hypothetical protein
MGAFETLVLGIFCGALLAGPNANHKIAIHVKSHPTSCAKGYPSFTGCDQIVTTWKGSGDIDIMPVFYDLTEFTVVEFGLMWPAEWYSMSWVRCKGDLAVGGVGLPGEGTAIAWSTCQKSWAANPGFGWLIAPTPGRVYAVPNPATGDYGVVDCSSSPGPYYDYPIYTTYSGICGLMGDNPCRPVRAKEDEQQGKGGEQK